MTRDAHHSILGMFDIDGGGVPDLSPDSDGDGLPDSWESGGLDLLNTDVPGTSLDVVRNETSFAADKPKGLLLLHHLNTDGTRAQVVNVKVPSTTKLTSSTAAYTYGGKPVFTATLTPSAATGTVTFKDNGVAVKTVAVSAGKAAWQATGQVRGSHAMTAVYNGDSTTAATFGGHPSRRLVRSQ